MSVNNIFRERCDYLTNNRVYKLKNNLDFEPYWDDGVTLYPTYNKGFKCSKKRIMNYQRRMYKTWKHNRNTQWK